LVIIYNSSKVVRTDGRQVFVSFTFSRLGVIFLEELSELCLQLITFTLANPTM